MGPFYAAVTPRFENFIEAAKLTGFEGLNTITGTRPFQASQAQRLSDVMLLFYLKQVIQSHKIAAVSWICPKLSLTGT